MDSSVEIRISASIMYGLLNEMSDILNQPLFNYEMIRLALYNVTVKSFETEQERRKFATLFSLYSSEKGLEKYDCTIDRKYMDYTNAMIGVLCQVYSQLNVENLREHYSGIIDSLQTRVETGEVSEADYLNRCNNIKNIVPIITMFIEKLTEGYVNLQTRIYVEVDKPDRHCIMIKLSKKV